MYDELQAVVKNKPCGVFLSFVECAKTKPNVSSVN